MKTQIDTTVVVDNLKTYFSRFSISLAAKACASLPVFGLLFNSYREAIFKSYSTWTPFKECICAYRVTILSSFIF